jgi:isopentenyl-diphosphate delta-isomerase
LLSRFEFPVIVKEVGQGMGTLSLKRLMQLPLEAVEFGAFGGTNFSLLEMLRADEETFETFKPFAYIGQSAEQMVNTINQLSGSTQLNCKQIIISGGIKSFLDGYFLMNKSTVHSIYGMASSVLKTCKGKL